MIEEGDRVPDIEVELAHGGRRPLAELSSGWLVLYFYPKDSTPGCTTEGLDFNALLPEFNALGAEVVGVSRDSVKSHQNFCAKQGFRFDLISDTEQQLCDAFGVIKEKSMYGRRHIGIERSTFLIDADGVVRRAWRPVKVRDHAADVLATLKKLAGR
jgi:thioredoxin-dependent peroxiredoxin